MLLVHIHIFINSTHESNKTWVLQKYPTCCLFLKMVLRDFQIRRVLWVAISMPEASPRSLSTSPCDHLCSCQTKLLLLLRVYKDPPDPMSCILPCDGYFRSAWVGPRVLRYLVKHNSGGVCWVFWDKINICIGQLSKADCPPRCGWATSHQLKACVEERDSSCCLSASKLDRLFFSYLLDSHWNISSSWVSRLAGFQTRKPPLALLVLRLLDLDCTTGSPVC